MRKWLLSCVSPAVVLPFAYPVSAQPPEPAQASQGDQISDIVVTAQRREESVQDVPIAITAFSGDQLRAQGINNTLQVAQFVPNLTAQNNTGLGSANAYFIRGLGSVESIPTFDPAVGTYVDDIYLSRQNANNLNLFDVERVEVLRGPQGTLFGRNTTGGAINVILRQPGDDFGGYLEAGYGSFRKKMVRGSVDAPLAPTFSVKISGYFQDDRGYVRNVTNGERLNDDDGWGARIAFRGELSPSVRWNGSYAHIVADGENILNFRCNPLIPAECDGRYISTGLSEQGTPFAALAISGRKRLYSQNNRTGTDLVTSRFDVDVADTMKLSVITGFLAQSQQYALDFFDGRAGLTPNITRGFPPVTGLPRGAFAIVNDGKSDQFTQEVKLNGSVGGGLVDYVVGAFYIKEDVETDFADVFLGGVSADRILRNSTEAIAGYAQADVNLGQFKLTAGVRYTDEVKKLRLFDNRPSCNDGTVEATCLFNQNLVAATGAIIPTRLQTKIWTPRFAVNFKPSDDLLFYASATRGFKSGGWNARESAPGRVLPFDPEKVWSYEGGVKSQFLNDRLRANITVFQVEASDLQVISGIVNANGTLSFVTRNPANYRNRGAELELTLVPARGLNLFANVGYSDDNYRIKRGLPRLDIYGIQSIETQLADCRTARAAGKVAGGPNVPATAPTIATCANSIVTAQGNVASPVRTPRFTVAFGGSYRAEFGDGWSVVPTVTANYRTRQEVGTANFTIYTGATSGANGTFAFNPDGGEFVAGSRSAPVWQVNATLALNAPNDAWQIAAECMNCFDEEQVQSTLGNYSYLNMPRSWMVRARHNF